MTRKRIVGLAGAVVGGLLLFGFLTPKPPEVQVTKVERGVVLDVVNGVSSGTLEPRDSRVVVSDLGGSVLQVTKRPGDTVTAGEVVMTLDPGELDDRLRIEKGNLDSARAALREANVRRDQSGSDYRKAYDLFKEGVFSRKQAEAAALAWRSAQSEVESLRTKVEQMESSQAIAQHRLDDTKLRAPVAGTLKAVHVDAGQTLAPKQPAFEVMDASQLVIEAVIDEADAHKAAAGQTVRITADALAGQTFQGRVAWVSPVVAVSKRAARGVEVRIEIDAADPALRVGMSVDVGIVVGKAENALSLPSNAVADVNGTPTVFVLERRWRKYGKVHARAVHTGIRTFNRVEIKDGVGEGELVLLNTDDKTQDGMKVRAGAPIQEAGE